MSGMARSLNEISMTGRLLLYGRRLRDRERLAPLRKGLITLSSPGGDLITEQECRSMAAKFTFSSRF